MAADRGISPQRARRLARLLEQASDEIEHDRRAALHELAAVGWPAPAELTAAARLVTDLQRHAHELRRRADVVEHQRVRKPACFSPPRRHASYPLFSFAKGLGRGVTATVSGIGHFVIDTAATPVQMASAAVHGSSPGGVLVDKLGATWHAYWQCRETFFHTGLVYVATETRRHGLATALDEWAYATGEVVPFLAVAVATRGGAASPVGSALQKVGLSESEAVVTTRALSAVNPPPPPPTEPRRPTSAPAADCHPGVRRQPH